MDKYSFWTVLLSVCAIVASLFSIGISIGGWLSDRFDGKVNQIISQREFARDIAKIESVIRGITMPVDKVEGERSRRFIFELMKSGNFLNIVSNRQKRVVVGNSFETYGWEVPLEKTSFDSGKSRQETGLVFFLDEKDSLGCYFYKFQACGNYDASTFFVGNLLARSAASDIPKLEVVKEAISKALSQETEKK